VIAELVVMNKNLIRNLVGCDTQCVFKNSKNDKQPVLTFVRSVHI